MKKNSGVGMKRVKVKGVQDLEDEINAASGFHGKLCAGIVIGVRMAVLGLKMIEITDPKWKDRKDLLIFAENKRCPIDALQSVTGCKISSGSLRIYDYGKMAASFLNIKTGKAVRIICQDPARDNVNTYAPNAKLDKQKREIYAYKIMPENELFYVSNVKITLSPSEMPGKTRNRVVCPSCNETISSNKGVIVNEKILCTPCAGSCYYEKL